MYHYFTAQDARPGGPPEEGGAAKRLSAKELAALSQPRRGESGISQQAAG
jgi:hypothetical protein